MSLSIEQSLMPSINIPIDARFVVLSESALYAVLMPYVGMHLWLANKNKLIIVKTLSEEVIPGWGTFYHVNTYDYAPLVDVALRKIIVGSESIVIPAPSGLTPATSNSLGGIKVGDNLSITSDGTLSGNYQVATPYENGLMSADDKSKLNTIEVNTTNRQVIVGLNVIDVPKQIVYNNGSTNKNVTEIAAGSNVTITEASGKITVAATDTTYSEATQSAAGLMSANDKIKLDGLVGGFKGYFATLTALKEAHPAANCNVGDFAVVGSTDTVWVIDDNGGTKAWKDTGAHSVTPKWSDITNKPVFKLNGTVIQLNSDADIPVLKNKLGGRITLMQVGENLTLDNNGILSAASGVSYSGKSIKLIKQGTNITLTESSNALTITATDTTYSEATQSAAGLMSATDKTKLDGVAVSTTDRTVTDGTNTVTVPQQIIYKSGGTDKNVVLIAASTNVSITETDGKLSISATDTTYNLANESNSGLLSKTDKVKLNKLQFGTIQGKLSPLGVQTTGKWSIDGGSTWNSHNDKLTVAAGKYKVIYKLLEGYYTPTALLITVTDGGAKLPTGTYEAANYIYYGYIPDAPNYGVLKLINLTKAQLDAAYNAGTVSKVYKALGIKAINAPGYSWLFAIAPENAKITVKRNVFGVDTAFSSQDTALQAKCCNGDSMSLGLSPAVAYKAFGFVQTVTASTNINFIKD